MLPARILELFLGALLGIAVGRQILGKDGGQHDQNDHDHRDDRHLVAAQTAPRVPQQADLFFFFFVL